MNFVPFHANSGPQERALSIVIRELLYGGARGGGKTKCGIAWIFRDFRHPEFRGLVIRKNYKDLCDWLDNARKFVLPAGGRLVGEEFRFPSGAIVRSGHLQDKNAYEKYQGHEYHKILIEELTQIPREEDYLRLISSCRSTTPELAACIFCTTNPGGPGHSWVKRRFIDPSPPGTAFRVGGRSRIFIPALLSDNPYLGDDYRKDLEQLPLHLRKAWLNGDWNALAGQYFDDFDAAIHVVKPFKIPDHWETHVAIDWGFNPDPFVLLFFAISEDGTAYLYREISGNRTLPADVAKKALDFCPKPFSVVGDPSMWARKDSPDSTAIQMQNAGLYLLCQANNDRIQGWTRTHEYLMGGKLRIFSTCQETIRCLPSLIHDPSNPEDALKDGSIDHHPDALRYFLMSRPLSSEPQKEKPIYKDPASERAWKHRQELFKKNKK